MSTTLLPTPRQPLMLAASLILAGAAALTVHVVMLAAGVPFPSSAPPAWARWLHLTLIVLAVLVFLRLAEPGLRRHGFFIRTLVTFAILLMVRETVRGAVMTGVVTSGWTFALLGLAEPVLRVLVVALACVVAVRWVRGAASLSLVALATAAICMGAHSLTGIALAPLSEFAATFSRPDLYVFPYPVTVTVAAYVTFIEPVVGAALLVASIWHRLPANLTHRLLGCALLVALFKGIVGATFVFSFFMQQAPLAGMFNYSQFLFEFLALGSLAGLAWHRFGARPSAVGSAPGYTLTA